MVVVAALGVVVAAPAAPAYPTGHVAKKCKKHKKKKKCRKGSAAAPTIPSTPSSVPPSLPNCPSVPQSSTGPVYIALGDSVAAGLGASCPANSYVNRLFANYQSTLGVTELLNVAQPGTSSGGIGGQVSSAVAKINDSSTDTKVVTINIGGVDALGSCPFGSDPCTDSFKTNFTSALSQLQGALGTDSGTESLIAMAYPNPYTGTGSPAESAWDAKMFGNPQALDCSDTGAEVGLNDAIDQVAMAQGALFANPYPAFTTGGQAFISSDHLHPNDAGYQAIANSFIAAGAPCT